MLLVGVNVENGLVKRFANMFGQIVEAIRTRALIRRKPPDPLRMRMHAPYKSRRAQRIRHRLLNLQSYHDVLHVPSYVGFVG